MKKLFYIFASAIVALGAVACQNDIEENINTNEGVETLSFTANFDEATRVAFDENGKTCWVAGDQIEVVCEALDKPCIFTNSEDDVNTFSCTAEGLSKIPGQEVTAIYSYGNNRAVDSAQGIAGSHLVATGTFPESEQGSLSFSLQNALLYFTAGVDVTFESNAEIFTVGGVKTTTLTVEVGTDTQYVAINPAEGVSFKYSVDGVVGKELGNVTFKVGTKYNLGELFTPVAKVGNKGYATIEDAIKAAEGATITLLADATVSQACQIDANNHTLTVNGNFLALKNYNNNKGYYDVVSATKNTTLKLRGSWDANYSFDKGYDVYDITGTNLKVAYQITFEKGQAFKMADANWATQYGAATIPVMDANTTIPIMKKATNGAEGADIVVTTKGVYNVYFDTTALKVYLHSTASTIQYNNAATTSKIYLKPNSNWTQSNAWFAAYFFNNNTNKNTWVKMTKESDGTYSCAIPVGNWENVIFTRMNSGNQTLGWGAKWNQTGDLYKNNVKGNLCTIKSGLWDCGTNVTWSTK